MSTNPRQFVTANAPTGAIPTNDWWSSLLFKRLNCRTARTLRRTRSSSPAARRPRLLLLHPAICAHPPPGLRSTTTPTCRTSPSGSAGLERAGRQGRRLDRLDGHPVAGATASRTMTATIGHGLPFTYFQTSPAGSAQISADRHARRLANSGATVGFTRQRPRLRRVRADRCQLDRRRRGRIADVHPGRQGLLLRRGAADHAAARRERDALAATYGRYAHAHVTGTRSRYRYDPAIEHRDHHVRVHHHAAGGHRDPHRGQPSTRTSGRH